MTRFFLAQNNPIIGNFEKNAAKIQASLEIAKKNHCSFVITSELSLVGYPPKDLLYYSSFFENQEKALKKLLLLTQNITLLVGCIRRNTGLGNPFFNSLAILQNGKLKGYYDKSLLPTYDIFNETRYFTPGDGAHIIEHEGNKIALTICEDIWHHEMKSLYPIDPLSKIVSKKPDLLINLSASPFELHKLYKRIRLCQEVSKKIQCPVLFCNQVGGQDSLIFDGYSFATDDKHLLGLAKGFEEDFLIYDTQKIISQPFPSYLNSEQLYKALLLGIRDYFSKQNFQKALIALSGGIDSALVTTLAVKALGKENVLALNMPSRFSSKHSIEDSKKLAEKLGIEIKIIPIESIHKSYLELFQEPFKELDEDITEENLQSRIRGVILMAFSNKFHRLVLSCGNKSEMAMGYATLYGDLAGGLAAISDITKSQVYEIAQWINKEKEVIPLSIIEKAPSAELKPDQKDLDTLPDYEILDKVIEAYVERHEDALLIAEKNNLDLSLVQNIIQKIHQSEYKRRQTPIGLKVTQKAFSIGWQFPIVHHHRP